MGNDEVGERLRPIEDRRHRKTPGRLVIEPLASESAYVGTWPDGWRQILAVTQTNTGAESKVLVAILPPSYGLGYDDAAWMLGYDDDLDLLLRLAFSYRYEKAHLRNTLDGLFARNPSLRQRQKGTAS